MQSGGKWSGKDAASICKCLERQTPQVQHSLLVSHPHLKQFLVQSIKCFHGIIMFIQYGQCIV